MERLYVPMFYRNHVIWRLFCLGNLQLGTRGQEWVALPAHKIWKQDDVGCFSHTVIKNFFDIEDFDEKHEDATKSVSIK